ncbi:MAG TPA: pirin family protein [Gammaproteobacteria bacterium]|nr:pirin family protein [Gammaproteobacteria bacterium]
MSHDAVLAAKPLGFPWEGVDPFLFCTYHNDTYPAGNEQLGPAASLAGRDIGQDFEGKDGWRMYHGRAVPGFPRHPHRGFETVTIMRRGYVDHSDSLGATARFGPGDVQWLTAGKGIVHSEMFPLLEREGPNPLELFQIWLNLPGKDKMAEPYFAMLWSETIPRVALRDEQGRATEIMLVAGAINGAKAPAPPPRSWASDPRSGLAIWTLKVAPGARCTLPAASAEVNRTLYFFAGESATIGAAAVPARTMLRLRADVETVIENGPGESEMLLLQGRPIGEPVVQYGPFVMSSRNEIQQAFYDYQRTEFGGWPWPSDDHVHPRDAGRHARYIDGRIERAG